MRVVMFPGEGNRNENRYLDVLVSALRAQGVDVAPWTKSWSTQSGDVFHVHWPQVIGDIAARPYQRLRGQWIEHQFERTIARVRRAGGKIVWTAHDLVPHGEALRNDPFTQRLMDRFFREVDDVICLAEASEGLVRDAVPAVAGARFHLGRHPHYRDLLPPRPFDPAGCRRLGATDRQFVWAFIGTLRPNKLPDLAARAVIGLDPDENFLMMAGGASPAMAREVGSIVAERPNCRVELARIAEEQVIARYACADALLFPGVDYLNSGTIYTALSLNVPVVAAATPVNAEIQRLVGERWLYLYDGALTADTLTKARATLAPRRANEPCDLSAFAPALCARQHLAAYAA